MGGSSEQATTTEPWSEAQPHLRDIFNSAALQWRTGQGAPTPYPELGVAPFTAAERGAQEGLLAFGRRPFFQGIQSGLQQAFGGGIGTDPMQATMQQLGPGLPGTTQQGRQQFEGALGETLQGQPDYSQVGALTEAATRPAMQQFQEQVLPSIRRGAAGAGQVGGSRQGIAEGIAGRGMGQHIADTSTRIAENERQRQMQRQMQGLGIGSQLFGQQAAMAPQLGQLAQRQQEFAAGLAPQLLQTGMLPYQLAQDVGRQQRTMTQAGIEDLRGLHGQWEQIPRVGLQRYASIVNPGAGMGGTQVQQGGGQNPFLGALSGAGGMGLAAAGIPGLQMPAILGMMAGGGLLGGLGSM